MRHVAAGNHLPDYAMTLENSQAVFWRRGDGSKWNEASRGPRPGSLPPDVTKLASSAERRIMVSSAAIEQLYEFAPGWDKYALENMYIAWAKDKEPARNEDARFHGWVKSFTKGKAEP